MYSTCIAYINLSSSTDSRHVHESFLNIEDCYRNGLIDQQSTHSLNNPNIYLQRTLVLQYLLRLRPHAEQLQKTTRNINSINLKGEIHLKLTLTIRT